MSLDFTAIDFETANRQRASVCSVGMTKVRGGQVIESVSWLIQPPTGIDSFEPENIRIHGITPADVAGAVDWKSSIVRIAEFIGEDRIVAYYAPFDKSVFRRSAEAVGATATGDEWSCAWNLAKKHLDLAEYKLPLVASELDIDGLNHHDAESDALVCAQVVLAIAARAGMQTVDELWPAPVSSNGGGSSTQKYYTAGYQLKKEDVPQPNPDANPHHPLYGQSIVVTGDFEKMARMEAFELAAGFGARVELNTTLKTSILVVCGEDPHAPGFDLSVGSGKQQKAHKYITERGNNIQILSEQDFYQLTGAGGKPAPAAVAPAAPAVRSSPQAVMPPATPHIPLTQTPVAASVVPPAPTLPASTESPVADQKMVVPAVKRRSSAGRGLLITLAIVLFVAAAFWLLTLIGSIAIGQGVGPAVFFIIAALLFGGGGVLLLRAARRR